MAGLRALQIHPERLDRLPAEFGEGMEPRAGLLGDVRGNHPDHWRRPLRHGVDPAREDRITLGVVHVAVMLRTIDAADPGHALHPLLAAEVTALGKHGTGLSVLAVEVTRSRTDAAGRTRALRFRRRHQPAELSCPIATPEPAHGTRCARANWCWASATTAGTARSRPKPTACSTTAASWSCASCANGSTT